MANVENLTPRQAERQLHQIVAERARGACEGSPKYPNCRATDKIEHPDTGRDVTLHMIRMVPGSRDPADCRQLCSRCVLEFDFPRHKTQGWREQRQAGGNLELFPIETNNGQ